MLFFFKPGDFPHAMHSKQKGKNALTSAHALMFKDTFDWKCKMIAPQFEPIMVCMIEAVRIPALTSGAFLFLFFGSSLFLSHAWSVRAQPSCLCLNWTSKNIKVIHTFPCKQRGCLPDQGATLTADGCTVRIQGRVLRFLFFFSSHLTHEMNL